MESAFILRAFVSSEVDLTLEQKVPPASRLFLWRPSPFLINSLCPFVGRPIGLLSRQSVCLHSSSYVDQSESCPAGLSFHLSSLSVWLQTAVVFCDTLLELPLQCGSEYECVCWGECQGFQYIVTSKECIVSLCRIYLCVHVSIVSMTQNNAASVSQNCKVVCGATRCLLSGSQGSSVKICLWYQQLSLLLDKENMASRGRTGQLEHHTSLECL